MYNSGDRGFFELVAPLYDLAMPAAESNPLSGGLARAQRPVDRVLDLGGGTGRASAAIRAAGDHHEPVVVDATPGMLSVARGRSLEAVTGDAGQLPVRSDGADGAVIVDALHHFPDAALALEETARVLRPGGVVVIREFDPGHPVGGLLAVGERAIGMNSLLMRPATLVGELETAGFQTEILDRGFTYTIAATLPS
jgi:Methylase involved in ubiquinone/menaquinone biosynthesis